MRAALAVLLLVSLPVAATPHDCDEVTWANLEACKELAAGRALDFMATQSGYLQVEAAAVAGVDIAAWPESPLLGRMNVPAPNGIDGPAIRLIGAAAGLGYNPLAFPTQSGPVNLTQLLLDNHNAVLNGSSTGALSFHIWSLAATGYQGPRLDEAARLLASRQQADGGFPCNLELSNVDCTGFATAALVASNHLSAQIATGLAAYVNPFYNASSGGYATAPGGKANAQTTAWVMTILHHTGEVPLATWQYVLGLQDDSGFFWLQPSVRGVPAWTTAEVLAVLTTMHPIQPTVDGLEWSPNQPRLVQESHGGLARTALLIGLLALGALMWRRLS